LWPSIVLLPLHLRLNTADEVRATLVAGGCPLELIDRCEQAYRSSARQPGFDGPFLIELTMLRLLVTIYQVGWLPPGYAA
jgi:hypothetical protein